MLGSWRLSQQRDDAMEHEAGEGDEVQPGHGGGQPFVAGQAAEARHPAEAALDHPAAGQQHEAAFGRRQPHYLQGDPRVRTIQHRP